MFSSIEELNTFLEKKQMTETKYFVNPSFVSAIVGYTDSGALVYEYGAMIASAMNEENWSEEDAIDWIEYNTLRTVPYMGTSHPIVIYSDAPSTDDETLDKFVDCARGVYYDPNTCEAKLVYETYDYIPTIDKDKIITYNKI